MKKKSFLKDKSLFRIAFLTNVFFFSVHFLQYVSYVGIVLILLWGIGLLIRDFANRKIKNVFFANFSGLFLALGVVSHTVNVIMGDGKLFSTIVGAVLLIITAQFMFLFMPSRDTKKGVIERELYTLANVFYYSAVVVNIIGIILLLVFKDSLGERIIIYDNRFVGAYINPNMGAFCSFVAIVSGFLLSNKKFCANVGKKVMNKWVCLFGMLLNYFVIAISDSKGALLVLTVLLGSCSVFYIYKAKIKPRKRHIIPALLCVLAVVVCVSAPKPCQKLMSVVVNSADVSVVADASSTSDKADKSDNEITFDHQSEKEKNGGGRLTLWKQCFEFFEQKPIFGWGCGNLLLMGEHTQANTIDNLKLDLGSKLFEAHNGYLTLLASSGITGFLTFMCFVLVSVVVILKNTFLKVRYGGIGKTVFATSCVLALLVYAVVEPSLVYYPTLVVGVFWYLLGASVKWATENEKLHLSIPTQKAIGYRLFDKY